MKRKYKVLFNVLKMLEDLSPRKGKREKLAAEVIKETISENLNEDISIQKFRNATPEGKSVLKADEEIIPSLPASFVSGKIKTKENIVSSLSSFTLTENIEEGIISFNPYCESISLATFYFSPSVAVKSSDIKKIIKAESIDGNVKIKKERFVSENIILGNKKNPKIVCFTHYDSILNGTIDNASGVAVALEVILRYPEVLKKSLFVFSGSEELSFEKPIYWGKGYRIFEEEYKEILERCKVILGIDCLGFSLPVISKNFIFEALPLLNLKKFYNKCFIYSGDTKEIEKLWKVYHSKDDNLRYIKKEYLEKSVKKLASFLLRS